MQQVHLCLFAAAKAASISVVARATWSIAPAFSAARWFHRFRSSDRQAEETQRAPRRLCSPFPAQKQTPASCKMQWSCRDHCWDANVRHTGQNLRKAHTFVSSAIFTTALTMLALSEMLLSMAFWMSSKSKILVTMPFRLICRKQRHQSPWGKCGDNGTPS